MRVVLLNPRDEYNIARGFARRRSDAQATICAPLGLLTVAALFPPSFRIEFVDENVAPINFDQLGGADLVLTGGMYSQRRRARFWIRELRRRGTPVVVGGPDVSESPLAYREADHLILGEAEDIFPKFIDDFIAGRAQPRYVGTKLENLDRSPIPRFDLLPAKTYPRISMQFGRGCPFLCEFCAVPITGGRVPRSKSAPRIIRELEEIRRHSPSTPRHVYVVDDNLISNRVWSRATMTEIARYQTDHGHPFIFNGYVSLNIVNDESLIGLLADAGFRSVFIGIESPDPVVIEGHRKYQNKKHAVPESIRKLNAYGITVVPGLVVGTDHETPPVAPALVAMLRDAGLPTFVPALLFAQPHTPLTARLRNDNRLLCEFDRIDEIEDEFVHCGLNFKTLRPRNEVLKDYIELFRLGFSPNEYFARVATLLAQFATVGSAASPPSAPRPRDRRASWRALRRLCGFFAREPYTVFWALPLLVKTWRRRPALLGFCVEQVLSYRALRQFARLRSRNARHALKIHARREPTGTAKPFFPVIRKLNFVLPRPYAPRS